MEFWRETGVPGWATDDRYQDSNLRNRAAPHREAGFRKTVAEEASVNARSRHGESEQFCFAGKLYGDANVGEFD